MTDADQEPCGATLEIDSGDIMTFGSPEPVMSTPAITLVCSRPWGHTPANRHSDGVTDWTGDEE